MFNKKQIKLGIAPIGWTNDDLPALGKENTFEQTISEMALAGFEGCEIGNKFPKDLVELKKALKLRNIQIANAWYSTFFTTKEKEKTIQGFIKHRDFLHCLGAKVIGVSEQGFSIQQDRDKNIFKDKHYFSEEEWKLLFEGLEELAILCEEKGMKLAFHHHMGTGVQTIEEIHKLMENTSDKVHLLIDTGHLYYACESMKQLLEVSKKYIHRTAHIHLKDIRKNILESSKKRELSFLDSILKGVFTVPGDGIIDYEPFFEIVAKANYSGWLLVEAEQDPKIYNPLEYALKARKYIKEKTGI